MMGSTMATTCTDVAAAISARLLGGHTPEEQRLQALDHEWLRRAKITECFADLHTILAEDNGSQRSVLSSCVYK